MTIYKVFETLLYFLYNLLDLVVETFKVNNEHGVSGSNYKPQ